MKKKLLAFILALTLCFSMSVTAMADYVSGVVQVTAEGQEVNVEVYEYTGEECSIVDILWFLENFAGMTVSSNDLSDCRDFSIEFPEGYVMPENGIQVTIKDENILADKEYVMVGLYWEQVGGPDAAWDCFGTSVPVIVTNGAISGTVTLSKLDEVFFVELKSDSNPTDTPSNDNNNTGENTDNNNTDNNTNNNVDNNINNEVPDTSWMEKIEPADLRLEDGKWLYYKDGVFDSTKYAYVSFNGGIFLVANGVLASEMNGLAVDPNSTDWYYLAGGQVQAQETGLVMYDNAWFYVNAGRLDTTKAGCVAFDGSLFYVAAGQIKTDVNGLAHDPITNQWYFLSNGQVQTQYTGLAEYDGEWFYVENGALAENYTGNVSYDGAVFYVVNGMLK